MFESILDTFGVMGTILTGLIALFFITRIPWWTAKACVPGRESVEAVQRSFPVWRKKGSDWIANFPELSVNGFFCTVLWPVTVALNLLLLAQVLEMFFPGGARVDIPKLGSYTVLSLLAGSLYSIAQTMFGVVAGEVGKGRKALASLFVLLLILTIAVEMGLAGYRAREIEKGMESVGPTMVDQTFSQGIILTMFLSFIVPVAHSVLGFVALPRFIGPLVGYVPRFACGLLVWVWSFFAKFYFGFQKLPQTLPFTVSALLDESRTVATSTRKLAEAVKSAIDDAVRFREIEKRWSELQCDDDVLAAEIKRIPEKWRVDAESIVDDLKGASEVQQFTAIDQRIRELQARVDQTPRLTMQQADALINRYRRLGADVAKWNVELAGLKARVPTLTKSFDELVKTVDSIEGKTNKQARILSPEVAQADEPILNPGDAELRMIHQQAMDFGNLRAQKEAGARHAACMATITLVRKELAETRAAIASIPNQVAMLETKVVDLETRKPVTPTPEDLKQREERLRRVPMEVMNTSTTFIVTIKGLNKQYHDRTRGLRQVPKQPERKFWLLRFFGWCGERWSGFIDMIVRSDAESKSTEHKQPSGGASEASTPAQGQELEVRSVAEEVK